MFKPEDTQIFKYYNGKKFVGVDPLTISLKFQGISDEINWEEISTIIGHEEAKPNFDGVYSKLGSDVFLEFLGGLRKIFGVPEVEVLDNGNVMGLSNLGVLQIYAEFVRWSEELKKNTPSTPISPLPMEQVGLEISTTSVSADCSSIVSGLSIESPCQPSLV